MVPVMAGVALNQTRCEAGGKAGAVFFHRNTRMFAQGASADSSATHSAILTKARAAIRQATESLRLNHRNKQNRTHGGLSKGVSVGSSNIESANEASTRKIGDYHPKV